MSEVARLAALRAFEVLDTPPEPAFDRLTALAADLFDAPMALVSLIDEERQWFKSRHGLLDVCTPRDQAFCRFALDLSPGETLVVPDATLDPRFSANPLVTGPMGLRFYAGAVLTTADGAALGTLCVLDTVPRPRPSDRQLGRLAVLAEMVVETLDSRRRALEAERERALVSLAEEMAGIGAFRFHRASGQLTWSDSVYAIHGVDRASFDPNAVSTIDFYHPEDRERVRDHFRAAIEDGLGFEYQARIIDQDLRERTITCKTACERDGAGAVVSIFGVLQDVTDQVSTLAEARRGEARFRLLADNMGDVITRIRLDGRSGYISPAIEDLLGYRPTEMVGRTAQSFVHPTDRALLFDVYAAMAEGADHKTQEVRAVRRDGSLVWVETHFKLVRDAEGAPSEMVAVIRDITVRKAMEAELVAARAAAEAAAAAKAEFLANMSHEIRTPLTAVIGFSGLLAAIPDLPPRASDHVRRIQSGGRALLATVNDILDFSKLEAGQVEIRPEACDPVAVAREALELFEANAAAKGLTLSLEGEAPAGLWLDPGRLRQILLNLVGNGVKFTDQGGVIVRLAWTDDRLRVGVADSGAGISSQDQALLFRKFSQIDASSTRRHGGTGLGLAICRGLAEAMGGEIGVNSKPGQGSTFWFDLPAPLAGSAARLLTDARTDLDLSGVRILVADDNPANRNLARALLEALGAECRLVADGGAAVQAAGEEVFDIILMDLRMPVLGGREAARAIRHGGGPNDGVPILAFTAQRQDGAVDPVFAGAIDKPIQLAALQAAITLALDGPPAQETDHAA